MSGSGDGWRAWPWRTIVRVLVGLLGAGVLVVGVITAYRAKSPVAVVVAGAVLVLAAVLGDDWASIRGKVAGQELEILRRQEAVEAAADEIDSIADTVEAAIEHVTEPRSDPSSSPADGVATAVLQSAEEELDAVRIKLRNAVSDAEVRYVTKAATAGGVMTFTLWTDVPHDGPVRCDLMFAGSRWHGETTWDKAEPGEQPPASLRGRAAWRAVIRFPLDFASLGEPNAPTPSSRAFVVWRSDGMVVERAALSRMRSMELLLVAGLASGRSQ